MPLASNEHLNLLKPDFLEALKVAGEYAAVAAILASRGNKGKALEFQERAIADMNDAIAKLKGEGGQ